MKNSTYFLVLIVTIAFGLLGTQLYYAFDKNDRILLEKIDNNQQIRLQNIVGDIELDVKQLQDELHFLSQLDSFNDLAVNDIDKRILQILQNKKASQKFAIELRVYNNAHQSVAETTTRPFSKERGLILKQEIFASLQGQETLGELLLYIPYTSLQLYFTQTIHHYEILSPQQKVLVTSQQHFSDNTNFRIFTFKEAPLKGLKIRSSLSQRKLDALRFSLWSYSAIFTIVLVSALLLFALYYSFLLYKQRASLQKTQLRLIEEANYATQVKSTFISQMSHEFRTPLNSIIGFSQFLSQEKLVEKEYENLPSNIEKAGKHLLVLVDNILELSKKEHHDSENFTLTSQDIVALTQEVVTLMQVQSQKKSLSLTIKTTLSRCNIMLDQHTYQQVIFNLLENAIKYTPEGSVIVSLQREDDFLVVKIKDSGIGITDTSQIFSAFVRLSNAQHIKGTGLGLALVEAYVLKLRATIDVLSAGENEGSTFVLKFKIQGTSR